MFISTTTVLSVRERRAKFNTIVLKESNDKLEGLIWLLNCSIKMLDSLDQYNTENTIDRDKVDGEEAEEHLKVKPNQDKSIVMDGQQDYRNARNLTAMSFRDSQKGKPREVLKRKYEQQIEMKTMQVETIDPDQIMLKRKPNDIELNLNQDNKSRKSGFNGSQYKTLKAHKSKSRTKKKLINTHLLKPRDGSRVSLRSAKSYNVQRSLSKNLSKYLRNGKVSDSEEEDSYDSEDDELFSDDSEREDEFQKEVDQIIDSVMKLDLGDAKSNKDLKAQMARYKEENQQLTNRSRRSLGGKSVKSLRSAISRKTNKSLAKP